ncbi:general secretion pathway protein GspN [Luteimonas saliphila]|uniref:general secretion pathway protein GspN n=1 Tax=Luteimonas saliphila TaxID=2804919 RepID=UPI00192D7666|nr:general secretion pathway protein GspN [Luteimonas saliphila]
MRAEDAGARTWLYAAFAGWALCVWVLAMFGMGGSIDRLDDDPSLRQTLPTPGAPGNERLGPLPQYGDIAARPLFTDNRRPQPFVIDPMGETGEASNDFDYMLTSVLRTPDLQMVILQPGGGGDPVRVKQGGAPDSAPGWVLQSVEARRAVFAGPEGERTLELRVFDGVGGQAPTAIAAPPADASGMPGPAPPAVADADMVVRPRATGGAQAPEQSGPQGPGAPGGATDAAAQQQAAQDQVEMIRRRIEERRARLRQEESARSNQPANQTK